MGQNNKKYLDYAGLEKLVDLHAVVPHPQMEITAEGAYKLAFDEHGHITSKSALTAADLGLDTALHFVGVSTTDPVSAKGATCAGHVGAYGAGDVCLYKRSGETAYEEYIYTGTAWELLGDADSYALKSVSISGDNTYITGGGTLAANRTLSHKTYDAADPAIKAIGRDSGGHVVIGNEIIVQSGGGGNHSHTTSTTIAKDTYVTGVTPTTKKLAIKPTKNAVITDVPGAFAQLNTTAITGVSGSTTASKATAGSAISIAKVGTAVRYGTADVGTEVTGLAKSAASTTTVGNANIATAPTIIGSADVGTAVKYGTANVGSAVTYGTADVGSKVTVATRANAQTTVGNADIATAPTTIGNANVGSATRYGTANVGSEITIDAGKADVGSAVVYGKANVGTAVSVAKQASAPSTFLTGVSATAPTTTITATKTTYNAEVSGETLVLTPVTLSATTTAPTLTPTTGSIYGVSESVSITPAVSAPNTQTLTPAVASNRTVKVKPATEAPDTQTLTPAAASTSSIYGAVAATTKIYGVGGTTDITPAVASSKTLTPAVAAPSTQTLTPAVAATATIYGAVASTTEIYGVTADQVSILPATAAPSTQTIIPAVDNGTITPYSFTNVTVPKAATSATTVATGGVSVGGAGATVMTGVGDISTVEAITAATITKGTTGDVEMLESVSASKNDAATFTGTTNEVTENAHTHTLAVDA
jgi:hypothetical protein